MSLKFLVILLLVTLQLCYSYKLLGVFVSGSASHGHLGVELMKGLAEKGHQVTVISDRPLAKPIPNYREVNIGFVPQTIITETLNISNPWEAEKKHGLGFFFKASPLFGVVSDRALADPAIQKLMKSNETFDAVIGLQFGTEALIGLSYHFNAPFINFQTVGPTPMSDQIIGNPSNIAITPNVFTGFSDRMNFKERVINSVVNFVMTYMFGSIMTTWYQEPVYKKYFPEGPPLQELLENTSLILFNTHNSLRYARPRLENMIDIAGFNAREPKPLAKDLQTEMDKAKDGVIFFSLGSNIKTADLDDHVKNSILNSFASMKQLVLWKWEQDSMPNQPKNVIIRKWFPQSDILAHPNVRLFITHGGWASTVETTIRGVPVIAIPAIGEQRANAQVLVNLGCGLILDLENITANTLTWTVNEVLNNPKYNANMKERARLFKDQETKPMDRANFWIEYVIRNKGAPHLRSAALHLTWWQFYLLDVIGIIILAIITVLALIYFICRTIYRFCSKRFKRPKSEPSAKKKN